MRVALRTGRDSGISILLDYERNAPVTTTIDSESQGDASKPQLGGKKPSKVDAPQAYTIPSPTALNIQLSRGTWAFKQGHELSRPISRSNLGFSSSIIIPPADLCEKLVIWQSDCCQVDKSALRRPGTHLKSLCSRIIRGQL